MALGRVPITRIRFEIPAWPGETNLVGDGVLLAPLGHSCLGVGLRSCFFLSLISWVFCLSSIQGFLSRLFRFLGFFRFFSRSFAFSNQHFEPSRCSGWLGGTVVDICKDSVVSVVLPSFGDAISPAQVAISLPRIKVFSNWALS